MGDDHEAFVAQRIFRLVFESLLLFLLQHLMVSYLACASAGGFYVGLTSVPYCLCSGIVFLSHFAWSRGEKDSAAGCAILSYAGLADATYLVLVFLFA